TAARAAAQASRAPAWSPRAARARAIAACVRQSWGGLPMARAVSSAAPSARIASSQRPRIIAISPRRRTARTRYLREVVVVAIGLDLGADRMPPLARALAGAREDPERALVVPTLAQQPGERVEISRNRVDVADLLGQDQPFLVRREREVVLPLAREHDSLGP